VKLKTIALAMSVGALLAISAIANAGSQCRELPSQRAGGLSVSDILLGNILIGHYDVRTCTSPDVLCGSTCTDLSNNINSCGSCGTVCASGETPACCGTGCSDLSNDDNNCGICGNACGSEAFCSSGSCESCGGPCACLFTFCITDGDCCDGFFCGLDLDGPPYCVPDDFP
jgi:Stigma-specific protein, Stig1